MILTTTLSAELGHNTSCNPNYNKSTNPASFTGTSWVTQSGVTQAVNVTLSDDSFNPVTPCHVSPVSVHTLLPGYKGKIVSQLEPYDFGGNHVNIGINTNTAAWAKAVCQDEQQRGVDGLVIDWYGPNRYEDSVALLLKAQIATMTNFTFAMMIDSSANAYTTTAQLESYLAYIEATYFVAPQYRTFNGKPILYMWGTPVPGVNYPTAFASIKTSCYVIGQGPGQYPSSWVSGVFDWVQPYLNGVSASDPYNLAGAKQSFVNSAKANPNKGCVLAISPGFNGTLTKTVAWSKGKMMPRNYGACWLAQSKFVAANLLPSLVEVLLCTGCGGDWEEGTEIGSAIDNGITVKASINGTLLTWSVVGGTGDESTISSYTILASPDGINAAIIGTQATGGNKTLDLSTVSGWTSGSWNIYVIAVAQPCIRNQVSATVPYSPIISMTGTFTGNFVGTFKGTFTPA